jgi:hypothetical protein
LSPIFSYCLPILERFYRRRYRVCPRIANLLWRTIVTPRLPGCLHKQLLLSALAQASNIDMTSQGEIETNKTIGGMATLKREAGPEKTCQARICRSPSEFPAVLHRAALKLHLRCDIEMLVVHCFLSTCFLSWWDSRVGHAMIWVRHVSRQLLQHSRLYPHYSVRCLAFRHSSFHIH